MTNSAESPVREGEIVAGKYKIERVLGSGGFGVVVAAQHVHLGEQVALKFLLPAALANAEIVERFLREARSAVKIKSEHVARVLDVGTMPTGAPYMVMEYLSGHDMGDEIVRRGQIPPHEAVEVLLQACEAIAEAHSLGIIHRDLKPANLFRTERPDGSFLIKVLDFGIAKASEGEFATEQKGLTATASVMGSPLFMSPEQMRSTKKADARSDIWSLGVILFQMLSGRLPFDADSMPGIVAMVFTEPVPSFAQVGARVPPDLEAIVRRCLEKSPEKRYESVGALAEALLPYASPASRVSISRIAGIQGRVHSSRPTPLSAVDALQQTHSPLSSTLPSTGPRRAILGGSLALVAALAVAGVTLRSIVASGPGAAGSSSGAAPSLTFSLSINSTPSSVGLVVSSPPPVAPSSASADASVASPAPSAPPAATPPTAAGDRTGKTPGKSSVNGQVKPPDTSKTAPPAPTIDRTVDNRH
jgi:serine/threonine-protein kinase